MNVLRSNDLQPQTEAEIKQVTKGPNTYVPATATSPARYVSVDPATIDTEYPRVMYRKRTPEEVAIERENLTKEQWMDPDFDLIQATKHNHSKKIQAYEAYVHRPFEEIVHSAKERKALGEGWTTSLKEALEAK